MAEVKDYITRIEHLADERSGLGDDIKEVYAEAKHGGLDTKALKETIRRRKMAKAERDTLDSAVELYEAQLEN